MTQINYCNWVTVSTDLSVCVCVCVRDHYETYVIGNLNECEVIICILKL